MSTEIISDAEIAGFMGWRGPGAYTQNSLRKIKRIVEEVRVRTLDRADSETLSRLQSANDAITTALQALGPAAPDCCGCASEWQVAIDALSGGRQECLADPGKPMADHIADTGKLIENNFGDHTDMAERIADIVLDDHVELMRENERLRRDLDAKDAQIDRLMWEYCPREMSMEQVDNWMKHQEPFTESRQCQSNINSPFNACQHKEYCCQLKARVETIDASTKPVEETQEPVHDGSTNICQNSTKLVETEQSQSADLSSKTPATHRYTGSFGE